MPEPAPLAHLHAALQSLADWLEAERVPAVLIGGVAASLRGRARFTRDVDAVVLLDEPRWAPFLSAGQRFGFAPRRPDAVAFARKSRVLLARHEPSAIDLDLAIGGLPFERAAVARAEFVTVQGMRLPLPEPEDLIVMKALAGRPRDWEDIASLVNVHPRLDRARIRRAVRQLAAALDMPDIETELARVLGRRPPGSRRRR